MKKTRNSKGRFEQTKDPKKYLIRVTEEEKQMIEDFRKAKKDE